MYAFLLELEPNWNKIGKMMCFCTRIQNTSARHPLLQGFSTGGDFVPRKYFTMSGDSLGYYILKGEHVPGIQCVETRDIAKHPPIRHKIPSKTKSYLDQNVNSSKDKKKKNAILFGKYILRQWEYQSPHYTEPISFNHTHTCTHTIYLNTLGLKA